MPPAERWWHGFSDDGLFLSPIIALSISFRNRLIFSCSAFHNQCSSKALVALHTPSKCQIKVIFSSPDTNPTCLGSVCRLLPCSLFAPLYTLAFELWQSALAKQISYFYFLIDLPVFLSNFALQSYLLWLLTSFFSKLKYAVLKLQICALLHAFFTQDLGIIA